MKRNYLARRVQIWFRDAEWANGLFEEIISNIPVIAIERVLHSSQHGVHTCYLTDGSTIKTLPTTEGFMRGARGTEIYIQDGVDKDTYDWIVAKCPIFPCSGIWVISSVEDFRKPFGMTAREYYEKCE